MRGSQPSPEMDSAGQLKIAIAALRVALMALNKKKGVSLAMARKAVRDALRQIDVTFKY